MFALAIAQLEENKNENTSRLTSACHKIIHVFSRMTYTEPFARTIGQRFPLQTANRLLKAPEWPIVVRAIVLLCSLHMIIVGALQYPYDIQRIHYEQMQKSNTSQRDKQEIENYLADRHWLLKFLGAPYIQFSMFGQIVYIYSIYCTNIGISQPVLLGHFSHSHSPIKFELVQTLAEPKREKQHMNTLLSSIIRRIVKSGEQFVRNVSPVPIKRVKVHEFVMSVRLHQRQMQSQLELLSQSALLEESNTSAEEIEDKTRLFVWAFATILTSYLTESLLGALGFVMIGVVPDTRVELQTWMDGLVLLEVNICIVLGCSSASYFQAIMFVTLTDLIGSINRMEKSIRRCVQSNNRIYSGQLKQSIKQEQINSNLLAIFVHYKLLIARLKLMQEALNFFVLFCLQLILLSPIVTKAHISHLPKELVGTFIFFCVVLAIGSDCCLLPVCKIHARISHLYTSLFSPLAHTLELARSDEVDGEEENIRNGYKSRPVDTYNPHIIWLIRKELERHGILTDLSAAKVLGFRFTYPNLVRLHFWSGLLYILLLVGDTKTGSKLSWLI